jgi:His-Xaa-Ser system radical SAM maturase HxsC
LTNGKTFSNLDFLNTFHRLQLHSVLAISFCADVDILHDKIVRSIGSFNKTEEAIYNLAKANEAIELRVVISKLNYQRLPEIAEYIYRNFPFVYHIAFMGLEYTGNADKNYTQIAINPLEYKRELYNAIKILDRFGMNVSIYNIPLCLLDERLYKYAEKSISLWKNKYHQQCDACSLRNRCCGVFTTSNNHPYLNIKARR